MDGYPVCISLPIIVAEYCIYDYLNSVIGGNITIDMKKG